jgi:DNA-binding CsgD family transcriptional regulator
VYLAYAEAQAGQFTSALAHADQAVEHADSAGLPALTSQVLAIHSFVGFLGGRGVNEDEMKRALELEEFGIENPIPLSASANHALILAWTGRLTEAHERMAALFERCTQRGDEIEMLYVAVNYTVIHIWRGSLADADRTAAEAIERAQQMGGASTLVLAHTVRAAVRAYTGDVDGARADIAAARAAAQRCTSYREAERHIEAHAFLELALGDHAAALAAVQPLLTRIDDAPGFEFFTAAYLPYAIEAMAALGKVDEAAPLVAVLEDNGARLDRPWMIVNGARGRAMLRAAQGDVEDAERCARAALDACDRLPMPFERARTLLLLGQLQRRRRRRKEAVETLTEALRVFEDVGITLWAERAREELGRIKLARSQQFGALTAAEQRVADLVASGLPTRDVAAELFISPKTVEHNLTRIYRKLGITSRAELWQRIQPE